jgi:prefoldin subunit 5
VSWFALHLDNGGEGILLARENPGPAGRASDKIFLARGIEEMPDDPSGFQKNITGEGLKTRLSAVLGISENIHIPDEGATRLPLEASARHAILFCLQAQDEIANRRLLFHRQGEQYMPAAIKDGLPYFLGAVDERHILTLKRYNDARARLRKLERDYAESRALSDQASNSVQSLLAEARRAGLLAQDAGASDSEGAMALLREAATPRALNITAIDDPGNELDQMENRRRRLRDELQDIREEIADVDRISRDASEFEGEAREQEARLVSIGILAATDAPSDVCPFCDSHLSVPVPSVAQMRESLAGLEVQLSSVRRDAPRLQERLADLESKRAEAEEQLRTVQRQIAERIQDNERLRIQQNDLAEQARVAGRIAYYLENIRTGAAGSNLQRAIESLKAEIAELEKALDEEGLEQRLETALNLVNLDLTTYARELALEHANSPLRLDRKALTVVADTVDGPLALSQMGSGENWVGYHVAAHLGLHKLFRQRKRPVPAFLMLDQPSQVHYPPERDNEGKLDGLADEDQAAVKRLFKQLWNYCDAPNANMQIIVADHVELLDQWFRDSIVQRWRDGIKLVPQTWLNS